MIRSFNRPYFGCDPEGFLWDNNKGRVIGSEKVIPEGGLQTNDKLSKVVRDGVQVEFNPHYGSTLPQLAGYLKGCFQLLDGELQKHPGISLSYREMIEVAPEELASLSPENQELGCQPSDNVYYEKPVGVDGKGYRFRSAGGHLHFGNLSQTLFAAYNGTDNRAKLVAPFDIFIGNTCVMLDRDPSQAERRKHYGRAGEYRKQPHGLEYRTLSNFWLRSYPLMSLVFGLGRVAIDLVTSSHVGDQTEQELVGMVNIDNFITAIDTNDARLARQNFVSILPFLRKHLPTSGYPLTAGNLDNFLKFCDVVGEKGLEFFFPENPTLYWLNLPGHLLEFDAWLGTVYLTK